MAQPKTIAIEVPELNIQRLTLRIVGTQPLVMHAWSTKAKQQIKDAQSRKPRQGGKKSQARDPQAEFEAAMYMTEEEHPRPGIPARLFKAAAINAANDVGAYKTVMKRAFWVEGGIIPIEGDEPKMREDMVRLETGVADIRYRPEWTHWWVTITIRYNAAIITPAHLINLMRTAGFGCGIGEGRMSSPKGTGQEWGGFDVESADDDG
jgi:hypothetical protein